MEALQEEALERALFVSPVTDMEGLIQTMMDWAGVTRRELERRGEIPTEFGETLSWEYLNWVQANPVAWRVPTAILSGERDYPHLPPDAQRFPRENRGPAYGGEEWGTLVPHPGADGEIGPVGTGKSVSPQREYRQDLVHLDGRDGL